MKKQYVIGGTVGVIIICIIALGFFSASNQERHTQKQALHAKTNLSQEDTLDHIEQSLEEIANCDARDLSGNNSNAAYGGCVRNILTVIEKERKSKMQVLYDLEKGKEYDVFIGASLSNFHSSFDPWVNEEQFTSSQNAWCAAEGAIYAGSMSDISLDECAIRNNIRAIHLMDMIHRDIERTHRGNPQGGYEKLLERIAWKSYSSGMIELAEKVFPDPSVK